MKIIKKVIYIVLIAFIILMMYTAVAKATTIVKVTTDTLNLRKEPSTDSDILTLLSNGDECELIEKSGDWYKIKYKSYTGYAAKEYLKEVSDNNEVATTETSTATTTATTTSSNETAQGDSNTTVTTTSENSIVGKLSKKTEIKIQPLIYSSSIYTANKDTEVTMITEINGWAYIQTSNVTGWIRSDEIAGKKVTSDTTTNNNTQNDESQNQVDENTVNNTTIADDTTDDAEDATYEQKKMYVNDSYVNLRKGPSTTSEVIMVVELNTELTVIGESGDWYKVNTSSGEAYVSKELLSNTATVTSRSGGIRTDELSSSSIKGEEIVAYAQKFLGVPYVYGGASPSGFDCSGFTMYVYANFGISMGHGAQAQAKLGEEVNADKSSATSLKQNLKPGDLVFFLDYETMDEIGHCGIYIGDGNFIHASSGSGYCVKINSLLPGEYYNTRYCEARRII